MLGIFSNMVVGAMVDRFGPRRVAIAGLFVKMRRIRPARHGHRHACSTGSGCGCCSAFGLLLVQSPVWTGAVAARFDKSRGLAMAVALSGTSLAAIFAPAACGLADRRLRLATTPSSATAAIWLAVTLPVVLLFFHDSRGKARAQGQRPRQRQPTGRCQA